MCQAAFSLPLLAALLGWAGEPGPETKAPARQRVVIPFDFESKFDDGQYGRKMSDMIWKKLERQGGFILPESMLDVRDWCRRNRLMPGPDTPLAKLKVAVRKGQGGDIGIWGKVERVAGRSTDVYDLWIYVADFSVEPTRMLYEKKVRSKTVDEIPHTYIKEALASLVPGKPASLPASDPLIRKRWETGPNLVRGDFQRGRTVPLGWDPLPKYVRWVSETGGKDGNRIVRFSFPREVAATTGVLYYSGYFPIEEGARYRFQCRWRSTGSAAKVFIKCYDEIPNKYSAPGASSGTTRREVYRSQQNLKGPANQWNTHTEDFTPKHTKYTPRWGRVMLYGYWPAGTVEWDDIIVKQIVPPRAGIPKVPRPSLESKVRSGGAERKRK
jgi:hypothetical protein